MAATKKRLQDCSPWLLSDTSNAEPAATARRLGGANPPRDETAAPPPLPLDVMLEILARSDVETIVRSAAVSRTLRDAVLDVGFRRRLALRAADHGGYDPGLLCGISYRLKEYGPCRDGRVVRALPSSSGEGPASPLIRFGASIRCTPVSSRDGLVLLRRAVHSRSDEFSVCDTVTGHTTVLPPMAITSYYPPVLLNVGGGVGGGRSFEVLAVDRKLQTQTYSSRDGRWSAVVPAATSEFPLYGHQSHSPLETSHPVVVGRTVHWLCYYFPAPHRGKAEAQIMALDVDAAEATVMKLPKNCMSRMTAAQSLYALMLVVSGDGKLGLVVSETSAISMWTFSASRSPVAEWRRRVLLPMPNWGEYGSIETSAFGERSGTVILSMTKVGLVQFNVAAAEQPVDVVLRRDNGDAGHVSQVCLHEINLDALLSSMKPYSSSTSC